MSLNNFLPCDYTLIQKASRFLKIAEPSFELTSQIEWSRKAASLLPKGANRNYKLSEKGGWIETYSLKGSEVNRTPAEWVGAPDKRFPSESVLQRVRTGDLHYLSAKSGTVIQMATLGHLVIAGDEIATSLSTPYASLISSIDLDIETCLKNAVHIYGRALLIADRFWEPNYAHWLLDVYTRLCVFQEDHGLGFKVIVSQIKHSWQRQMLAAVGIKPDDIVELEENIAITADTLIVPSDTGGAVQHPCLRAHPIALQRIRKYVKIPDFRQLKDTVIVVSRKKRGARILVNESELVERLERYTSVFVTNLEDFSVEEQWGIFHWSKGVCAVHGAGLANTVMLGSENFAVEILPTSYANPAFWMISQGVGARYLGVTNAVEEGTDKRPILRDVRLPRNSIDAIADTLSLNLSNGFQ